MKLFKVLILVLLLTGLSMPAMAADPIKAGEEMISGGIRAFFTDAADSVFNWGINSNETIEAKDKYGYSVGSVFKIAANKYDPYESETVQEMRKKTAVTGVFLFILYVFYGAACVNLSCSGMGFIERTQYVISETPLNEYKNILLKTFAAIFFTHYIFKFIILFNAAATYEIMYSVADSIQLTQDHWVMYCMMALCYGAELGFFAMRLLLMDLMAGSDILIGSLFAFAFTRELSIETVKYFGKITLLQFIIVLFTAFGIAIIGESPNWQPLKYLCLMVVLFIISGGIMFGFSSIFKSGKVLVKRRL
jgi:hypothetical protein